MKPIYKISIISGLGLIGIGVLAYFNKQVKLLKDACFTLAGAIINEITYRNVSFTMLVNIANKSDIDFTVINQNYNVYVNDMLVAIVNNDKKILIKARGTSTVSIDISFNPQDLLKKGIENINFLLGNKESLVIDIKGHLSLKSGIVTINDYQVDEKLSLKELLSKDSKKQKC